MRRFFEIIGSSVALGCILWVLSHLVAFDFYGHFMVGESNKLILYSEIVFVSLGLICFSMTYFREKILNSS